MSKETGGPAFPQSGLRSADGRLFESSELGGTGMTLRDHFAGSAMQGLLANEQCKPFGMSFYSSDEQHAVARQAYRIADAMIKARNN